MSKSKLYAKLSKHLREACGTCGFNLVQNENHNFFIKKSMVKVLLSEIHAALGSNKRHHG